jgi:hypothetical protein
MDNGQESTARVSIKGLDDKREITALLAVTSQCTMLPPQLLYSGKTMACHPQGVQIPADWDI